MTQISKLSYEPIAYDRLRRCPHCTALSRLTHSLLDTRQGSTVHVYLCLGCGKRIWDERSQLRARLQ
jgi:DNA-directed RNA polymerase subunit RPC12/RpoP